MFKFESVLLSDYLKDWYKNQNTLSCFRNTLQVVPAPSFRTPGRVHPGLHFEDHSCLNALLLSFPYHYHMK